MVSIEQGDVVMIKDLRMWDSCLMVVDEVRSWGVIGVVVGPDGFEYPLRVGCSEIAIVYRNVMREVK